ncbi:competence protein ComEA [Gracilibacillus ureilyticus]|uniref:Competence protein ComEA n=1 Tax=Gracilibacillus ureilyticus TaxID=531814 RepID=A0A1H9M488_9BACI|nr:helix-hairpin-helix domain-containing protein [Gracilibacillus ureilyticus]SER18474.1 competence protein ComEA [Gracilibacillus ureilyticus]
MTVLQKYWHIALIGVVIILLFLINPFGQGFEPDEQNQISLSREPEMEQVTDTEAFEIKMVDIKGEVNFPGVYEIRAEERVIDVIDRAGGLTEYAAVESINMAERVYDEMVIYITAKGEGGSGGQSGTAANGKIRINQATKEELMTISGIGEVKAEAILNYRETYGKFKKLDDLSNVSGIGGKTIETIEEFIQIP